MLHYSLYVLYKTLHWVLDRDKFRMKMKASTLFINLWSHKKMRRNSVRLIELQGSNTFKFKSISYSKNRFFLHFISPNTLFLILQILFGKFLPRKSSKRISVAWEREDKAPFLSIPHIIFTIFHQDDSCVNFCIRLST